MIFYDILHISTLPYSLIPCSFKSFRLSFLDLNLASFILFQHEITQTLKSIKNKNKKREKKGKLQLSLFAKCISLLISIAFLYQYHSLVQFF